ncbi:DUF4202 domain-containing protein [Paraglaciecola hydrolytica]|uniref:DUF4202 domain-containing protein n=1 Tax=Paraglaciecola hydrolytica TaxID=1799789 RepID=A0A136A172_9ALTE|nr:DUF4202 domain-containing protein [Paraglaciecola hydrolytica]KXI28979.1 hypothetical protein AX660_12455 [Paraglaciecola hydrolytica]
MTQTAYELAVKLIDNANSDDPNIEQSQGKDWPKELLYGQRMSAMLERYKSNADEVIKLAIRGQHIQRWLSPRSAYPMDRQGYHKWRSDLYVFHADKVAAIMKQAGFSEQDIARAKNAVAKVGIKSNPDTQLLEDVVGLVFIEHYMLDFAAKHPEYTEQKWIDIIRKTWAKMSKEAHAFVLAGNISLPEALTPIIVKAVQA